MQRKERAHEISNTVQENLLGNAFRYRFGSDARSPLCHSDYCPSCTVVAGSDAATLHTVHSAAAQSEKVFLCFPCLLGSACGQQKDRSYEANCGVHVPRWHRSRQGPEQINLSGLSILVWLFDSIVKQHLGRDV
eukprot:6221319-Amphidinium_carterae.1